MMLLELLNLRKNKILAGIYTNKETPDSFAVGYILNVNENDILVELFNPRGEFDGYFVKKTNEIYDYEKEGDEYIDKIKKLIGIKNENEIRPTITITGNNIFDIINYANINNFIMFLLIENYNDAPYGYIKSFKNNIVNLMEVSEYGEDIEEIVFRLDQIVGIYVNDNKCADIKLLRENK